MTTARSKRSAIVRLVFLTAALGVLISVIAGYFLLPPAVHFRLFNDQESFARVMSQEVREGMTVNEVQGLLGIGEKVLEPERQQLIKSIGETSANFDTYPDGVTAEDQFINYSLGTFGVYLQYREGKLVNHSRREFAFYLSQVE